MAVHCQLYLPVGDPRELVRPLAGLDLSANSSHKTFRGSFSAVWTATIARNDSFCSIFRDLQDLQSFAPLRSQNLQKFCIILREFSQFSRILHIFAGFFRTSVIFHHFSPKFSQNFESGAVQKQMNLVDLEKFCNISIWTPKSASIQKIDKRIPQIRPFW